MGYSFDAYRQNMGQAQMEALYQAFLREEANRRRPTPSALDDAKLIDLRPDEYEEI